MYICKKFFHSTSGTTTKWCYYKEKPLYIKKPQQIKRMEKESKRKTAEGGVSASFGLICNLCSASEISEAREIIPRHS